MLRWSLPETTTTVKFDVYSVVTGSVTPASCCCFSSSPNWIGRHGKFRPLQTGSHCCHSLWSLSTSGTLALGPVTYDILLFPWCSSQNPRHTHTHAGTYTRAHAHTQGTMPCCGCCCWRPWPGGKFFATVPTRKEKMANKFY